jgi:hypothetical protein
MVRRRQGARKSLLMRVSIITPRFSGIQDTEISSPISTYGGQGVAKRGTRKGHHAIAYVGTEPEPTDAEILIAPGDHAMMPSIRIQPRGNERMDPMSRINFADSYTVHYNAKVYDFGDVHPASLSQFMANYEFARDDD